MKTIAYHKRRVSHLTELYYILSIIIVVALTVFSILGPGGYRDMRKARLELEAHRARVEALKRNNSERLRAIQALRTDGNALEKYARENGYGREGEIVQRLPQEAAPPKK